MSGVISVGIAVTAIATAVATEFATFAVIAAVGATVGAIGTVTGVKELKIAGAAIGIVGAVGGLASAAGVFGAEGLFGAGGSLGGASGAASGVTAAAPATYTAESLSAATGALNESVGFASQAGTIADVATPDIMGQVVQGLSGSGGPGAAPVVSGADGVDDALGFAGEAGDSLSPATATASKVTGSTGMPSVETPGAPGFDPEANASGLGMGQGPSGPSLVNSGSPVTGSPNATPTPEELIYGGSGSNNPAFAMSKSDGPWGDIWGFIKKNPTLAGGAIQAGASFLSGAMSPLTPAQQAKMEAEAKANQAVAAKQNAEANILNIQANNMQQPIPVASRVTGRPQGLVNQITGAPT